jgi:hypothetical protein
LKHFAQVRGLALASPVLALAVALAASAGGGGCSAADTPRALRVDGLVPDTAGGLVISQVYGGGGNTGATYANDYVELFNAGTTAVSVGGMSVQYAAASSGTWHVTPLSSKSIPAGGYYLVAMASGGSGGALPAADDTGTSDLAETGGKVALVDGTTALTCSVANMPHACVASSVDLVGWGTALDYAGSDPTGALTATTAAFRDGAGCTDTGDNKNDFTETAAGPRNSATPAMVCGAPPADAGADGADGATDGGATGTGGDAGDSGTAASDGGGGGSTADSGAETADSGAAGDDDSGDDDDTDLGNIDAGDNASIVPISDANSSSCASAGALRDERRAALSFGALSLVTLAFCRARRRGASRKKVTHR